MLDLAGDLVGLEAAQQGAKLGVVGGVEGVEDGLGALLGEVQGGEELGDAAAAGVLGDHVEAGVGPQLPEHPLIVVAQAGVVELHHDAQTVVGPAQAEQEGGLIALGLLHGEGLAGHGLAEGGVSLFHGAGAEGHVVQAVVAGPAAHFGEELQPLHQGVADLPGGGESLLAHAGGQLGHVAGEAGLLDVDGPVGAEGGADLEGDGGVVGDLLMPLQGVDGVVGGADEGHVGLADEAADGEVGVVAQLLAGHVPDLLHGLGGEVALIAEELPQLQVAPVVHGVADGHLHGLGELLQPLQAGLGAGDIVLADAVGAHEAPLVVVAEVGAVGVLAPQPHLGEVVEAPVLVDLLGGNVAVVVHQGEGLGVVMEEVLCGLGLQKEILVHKCFHGDGTAPGRRREPPFQKDRQKTARSAGEAPSV